MQQPKSFCNANLSHHHRPNPVTRPATGEDGGVEGGEGGGAGGGGEMECGGIGCDWKIGGSACLCVESGGGHPRDQDAACTGHSCDVSSYTQVRHILIFFYV